MNDVFRARAPSNIALIKYWGKRDASSQWPSNDSLSMTLSRAFTETTARALATPMHELYVADVPLFSSDPFAKKIFSHLKFLAKECGFNSGLRIDTKNTFPSSCGIASSASGFAALTIAALACWNKASTFEELEDRGYFLQKIAHLARLGSGSACRSVAGGFVAWRSGATPNTQSIEIVQPAQHWDLADIIVIISDRKKTVSSSAGHLSANSSPLFRPRVAVIEERMAQIRSAIAAKDLSRLGPIIETDALDMHSVMLTSQPSINYFSDATVEFISWLRTERQRGDFPAYFTLDAGPNPHLICEAGHVNTIATKIAQAFPRFELLLDQIGNGPQLDRVSSS